MRQSEALYVAVGESSAVLRSGLSAVLQHLPELHVHVVEAASPEALDRCLHGHRIDLLIVNPAFGGWFDLEAFRASPLAAGVKCLALPVAVPDASLLEGYDAVLSLYDDTPAETFSGNFADKACFGGVGAEDIPLLAGQPDGIKLAQTAAQYSDGIIMGSDNVDGGITAFCKQLGLPVLEYDGASYQNGSYVDEYCSFYDRL